MSKVLEEKNFINESNPKGGWRIWLGLALVTALFVAFLIAVKWMTVFTSEKIEKEPFLQVTNREFSLFLWQNPEFMRSNRKKKSGYLSDFHLHPKVTPKPKQADTWVSAPPDILFLYHAWNRLLSSERFLRPVSAWEFREFLDDAKEWHPQYWTEASEEYRQLVIHLDQLDQADIQKKLPDSAIRAFLGWKNYFQEGKTINQKQYTAIEIQRFIEQHPHYASHYWKQVYPDYLRSLENNGDSVIPSEEIPSFLKVALYNLNWVQ